MPTSGGELGIADGAARRDPGTSAQDLLPERARPRDVYATLERSIGSGKVGLDGMLQTELQLVGEAGVRALSAKVLLYPRAALIGKSKADNGPINTGKAHPAPGRPEHGVAMPTAKLTRRCDEIHAHGW